MAEMTDTELSLKVATIMYPEYEWKMNSANPYCFGYMDGYIRQPFNYQDKACAFDMSVWLARQYYSGAHPVGSLRYNTKISSVQLRSMLETRCPEHALAMAILETGEDV